MILIGIAMILLNIGWMVAAYRLGHYKSAVFYAFCGGIIAGTWIAKFIFQ